MQIDLAHEQSFAFKITNDGDDAIGVFYDVMKKIRTEACKKGFKNMFNHDEKLFIKEFTNKMFDDET